MTSPSAKTTRSDMPGDALMLIGLNGAISPEQFAAEAAKIAALAVTQASHRAMDALCMKALRSLGYGAGCDVFEQVTNGYHQ